MGRFRTKRAPKKNKYFRFKKRPSVGVLIFVIFLALFFQLSWFFESNIYPMMLVIAKTEVKQIAQEAMLKGIQQMQKSLDDRLNNTIEVEKGPDGRITFVKIDTQVQAKIYSEMTTYIHKELEHVKDRKLEMTVGQILQSNLFSQYGPKIPFQIWPKGSTLVSVVPKLESKGINMTMVTLNVHVKNDMGMIVPFSEEDVSVSFDYPIAQALVVGEVPQYYFYNDQGEVKKGQSMIQPPPPTVQPNGS